MESNGTAGIDGTFPGTVLADIKQMGMPYGIYVNPYTGYIYATDAGSFAAAGALYQWSPEGKLLGTHRVYINPAHFLALKPDNYTDGIDDITVRGTDSTAPLYDIRGMKGTAPQWGNIYIRNGKKFIFQ